MWLFANAGGNERLATWIIRNSVARSNCLWWGGIGKVCLGTLLVLITVTCSKQRMKNVVFLLLLRYVTMGKSVIFACCCYKERLVFIYCSSITIKKYRNAKKIEGKQYLKEIDWVKMLIDLVCLHTVERIYFWFQWAHSKPVSKLLRLLFFNTFFFLEQKKRFQLCIGAAVQSIWNFF